MSAIPFQHIPSNLRVPLFYAEVNNSQANTATGAQRALLIGQVLPSGAAVPNVPLRSLGAADAIQQGGAGSVLALMAEAYFDNDSVGEAWYLPLQDAAGAVAATGSITVTAGPTAAGTLSLYINGQLVPVAVAAAETPAQVATAIAAAVTAMSSLPVTATVDGQTTSKVDLVAKNAGLVGNEIDVRLNYQGAVAGEVTPEGMTVTIAAFANGATNPSLTAGLANLQDMAFDFIACSLTDAASLTALQSFMNDSTGRWSYAQQIYGHVFYAYRGTAGSQTTFGLTRNNPHESVLGFNDSPSAAWQWAAALTGAAAQSLRADPALPLQTVPIYGVLAPPLVSRFAFTERNVFLFDGVSTFTVDDSGQVYIESLITTYQTNAFGQADDSYLKVETLFTLAYALRAIRSMFNTKYARVKLVDDGTRIAPGSGTVSPSIVKADYIAKYQELEQAGIVQDSAGFAKSIIVQRNPDNPNRLDTLWPGTLINQLNVMAMLAQFRLMAQ